MTVKEKLDDNYQEFKDLHEMCRPVINYIKETILKESETDSELNNAVLQEKKTLKKCYEHVYKQAENEYNGIKEKSVSCVAIDSEQVKKWAIEYYKQEEKEEPEKKVETVPAPKIEKTVISPVEKVEPVSKNTKKAPVEGQLTLF